MGKKEGKRQGEGAGGKEGAQRCPDGLPACCSSERVEKTSLGLSCFCVGSGENQMWHQSSGMSRHPR